MLATAADRTRGLPADGRIWAYEVKWDGIRVLADLHDGAVHLVSRRGNEVCSAKPPSQTSPTKPSLAQR